MSNVHEVRATSVRCEVTRAHPSAFIRTAAQTCAVPAFSRQQAPKSRCTRNRLQGCQFHHDFLKKSLTRFYLTTMRLSHSTWQPRITPSLISSHHTIPHNVLHSHLMSHTASHWTMRIQQLNTVLSFYWINPYKEERAALTLKLSVLSHAVTRLTQKHHTVTVQDNRSKKRTVFIIMKSKVIVTQANEHYTPRLRTR